MYTIFSVSDRFYASVDSHGNVWCINKSHGTVTQVNLEQIVSVCNLASTGTFVLLSLEGIVYTYDATRAADNIKKIRVAAGDAIVAISSSSGLVFFVTSTGAVYSYDVSGTKKLNIADMIVSTHSGLGYAFFIGENGSLWLFNGSKSQKEVCFNETLPANAYSKVLEESNISSIACGENHALFILDDGTAYSCGSGNSGQLGLGGNIQEIRMPKKIPNLHNICSASCTTNGSFLLSEEGAVWFCGGTFMAINLFDPQQFRSLPPIQAISSGCHSISDVWLVAEEGSFWRFDGDLVPKKCNHKGLRDHPYICGRYQQAGKSARK